MQASLFLCYGCGHFICAELFLSDDLLLNSIYTYL
jgi:hypothetical protein